MNALLSSSEQDLGQRIWTIVELFYRSHTAFRELFESYEERVLSYTRLTGRPREELRLKSDELGNLLDLKSLERLRDDYIQKLKDLCHLVFRWQDQTDLLDRYVSDIFHEISILKEEHYNVKVYGPLYERDSAEVELRHILDDAHARFPQELSHIRYLFGQAQLRLEEHLSSFREMELFNRSLFMHADGFVQQAYPEGIARFYKLMFPGGALEGYYTVGLSFYLAGFREQAAQAFTLAEEAYRDELAVGWHRLASNRGPEAGAQHGLADSPLRLEPREFLRSIRLKQCRLTAAAAAEPTDAEVVPLARMTNPMPRDRRKGS